MDVIEKYEFREVLIDKIMSRIQELRWGTSGEVNFILYKQIKGKIKTIVGFIDRDFNQMIIIDNTKMLGEQSIKYNKMYEGLFDECIESYILTTLQKGYSIAYMDLPMHSQMWSFIDAHLNEADYILKGVYRYIDYCMETGITYELIIDNFGPVSDDLIDLFYYVSYWEYGIERNFLSGLNRFAFGYKTVDNKRVYGVFQFTLLETKIRLLSEKEFTSKEKAIQFLKSKITESNCLNQANDESTFQKLLEEI